MKAVILAGGLGSRLSEETDVRPKPLVEVGGKPIIWHIMKIYAHHGVKDFIICAGYKGHMLKRYFVDLRLHQSDLTIDLTSGDVTFHNSVDLDWRVTIVDTGQDSMTGGRLKRIRPFLDEEEPFCMTYGDGVGDIDISAQIAYHREHGLDATMTVVSPPGRFGAVHIDDGKITRFMEKPETGEGVINGGFFILHPRTLDLVSGDDTIWERDPLERLAAEGRLAAFPHKGFWQPMDTLRDKRMLEDVWESGDAPWKVWA